MVKFHVTFVTYTQSRNCMQGLAQLGMAAQSGFEFRAVQRRVCRRSGATVPADGFLGSVVLRLVIPAGHEERAIILIPGAKAQP